MPSHPSYIALQGGTDLETAIIDAINSSRKKTMTRIQIMNYMVKRFNINTPTWDRLELFMMKLVREGKLLYDPTVGWSLKTMGYHRRPKLDFL